MHSIISVLGNFSLSRSLFLCPLSAFPFCWFSALLYLNPMLIASAFATAAINGDGELQKLLAFGGGNAEAEAASKSDA